MEVKTRISPVPPDDWTHDARTMFTLFEGPDAYEKGSKSNVFLTLAHHPKLGSSFFKYNGRLLMSSRLSASLREVVILRVAWLSRSPYEWAQHVEMSLLPNALSKEHIEAYKRGEVVTQGAGLLEPAHIEAVKRGPDDPIWSQLESNAIRAVDELKENGVVSDPTWQGLAEELSTEELFELLFFIGTYTMLAWILNTVGIQPEASQIDYARDILDAAP